MAQRGTHWSETDLKTAKAMFDAGASYEEIGDEIGRGDMAVYDMLRKRFGVSRSRPDYFEGDPIGLTVECQRYRSDCKLGSKALREAITSLFERMPARKVAEVIGKAHLCDIPGLQPVIRGQLAERRLAA